MGGHACLPHACVIVPYSSPDRRTPVPLHHFACICVCPLPSSSSSFLCLALCILAPASLICICDRRWNRRDDLTWRPELYHRTTRHQQLATAGTKIARWRLEWAGWTFSFWCLHLSSCHPPHLCSFSFFLFCMLWDSRNMVLDHPGTGGDRGTGTGTGQCAQTSPLSPLISSPSIIISLSSLSDGRKVEEPLDEGRQGRLGMVSSVLTNICHPMSSEGRKEKEKT